ARNCYRSTAALNAVWTGGQFGSFRDVRLASYSRPARPRGHDSHGVGQRVWFRVFEPGHRSEAGGGSTAAVPFGGGIPCRSCYQNRRSRRDVDTAAFVCQKAGGASADCYEASAPNTRDSAASRGATKPVDQSSTYAECGLSGHGPLPQPGRRREALVLGSARMSCRSRRRTAMTPGFGHEKCDRHEDFFCRSMLSLPARLRSGAPGLRRFVDCVGKEDEDEAFWQELHLHERPLLLQEISQVCDGLADCDLGDDETEEACMSVKAQAEAELANEFQMTAGIDESSVPADAKLGDLLQEDSGAADPAKNYELVAEWRLGQHEGRIEIRLFNQRGLVCDDGLNAAMADVICQQLGYPGHERFHLECWQQFGRGTGGFILSGVHCGPGAKNITDCAHRPWGDSGACSVKNVAGLICLIDRPCSMHEVRCDSRCFPLSKMCDGVPDCSDGWDETECDILNVTLSHNRTAGVVEISRGGIQGVVCDDHFSDEEVKVVCRHLGIPGRGALAQRGQFSTPAGVVMWLQDIRCEGTEASLFDCSLRDWGESTCSIDEAVQLLCGLP
uniref:SRCR domain-containing protein n=1 Tax=Macrostomum lignano TaxID=282301 RepID=A0A1I8FA67_9PLAT